MPTNTLRVHTEDVLVKSGAPKVLRAITAETTGAGCWRIFPSSPAHATIVEVEIGGVAIYSIDVQPVSGSSNLLSLPSG
ncbi:hypothetical protein TNCV_2044881 [Trichonephila clavipes]|nr:hypothetical protein TNCV_2044881 [Trichonephila clavipes]